MQTQLKLPPVLPAVVLFILATIGLPPVAAAEHEAGLPLTEVVSRVKAAESNVRTLQARFIERVMRRGLPTDTMKGELTYALPHRMRVDQRTPEKQIILWDGDEVKIYNPGARQLVTGKWKQWLAQTNFPAPLLSFVGETPAAEWEQRYNILFGGYDAQTYKLIFRPKRRDDSTLELWVSDDEFLPVRGRIPGSDVTTEMNFEHLEVNKPLPKGVFTPEIPRDTVIVPMPS